MQQRRAGLAGRPLGTDGSDFSYRMVVDSRYTKVAKGKSLLKALLVAQIISQIIGSFWWLLSALEGQELNQFTAVSSCVGFISPLIGEIGRRHSQGKVLRLYIFISSIATTVSVACFVRSDSLIKAIQYRDVSFMTNYELVELVRVFLGVPLQIIIIVTTITLVHNMSPPKRS